MFPTKFASLVALALITVAVARPVPTVALAGDVVRAIDNGKWAIINFVSDTHPHTENPSDRWAIGPKRASPLSDIELLNGERIWDDPNPRTVDEGSHRRGYGSIFIIFIANSSDRDGLWAVAASSELTADTQAPTVDTSRRCYQPHPSDIDPVAVNSSADWGKPPRVEDEVGFKVPTPSKYKLILVQAAAVEPSSYPLPRRVDLA
ncbi:hypothetical protein B0H19DRAFT_1055154 [Mycena capillaripes]|nr:hypothetical protein B0H19DRAFT_1055154 [Mycena capillaripes]